MGSIIANGQCHHMFMYAQRTFHLWPSERRPQAPISYNVVLHHTNKTVVQLQHGTPSSSPSSIHIKVHRNIHVSRDMSHVCTFRWNPSPQYFPLM